MEITLKLFTDLSNVEAYDIFRLRAEVFVVEQQCAYLDPDDKDTRSIHLQLRENGRLVGYCRILPPGVSYEGPSIGRVAVRLDCRGRQLGRKVMQHALAYAVGRWPRLTMGISAQSYLRRFYEQLGFEGLGGEYLEDNIPHIHMEKVL